jgi:Na+/H+ antiporter NhaA
MLEIGLDLKKEFVYGELQTYKRANLPLIAAIGGLLFLFSFSVFLTKTE